MSHYFLAGNLWLLATAVVYWGRDSVVSNAFVGGRDYSRWRLFGVGRDFYAYQYPWFLGALIAMAVLCFLLHLLHLRCSRSGA
jgi:hypothetical protein